MEKRQRMAGIFDIEVSEKSQATACKSEYFDKYNHLPDKLKEQPQQQINIDDLAERVAEKLKMQHNRKYQKYRKTT